MKVSEILKVKGNIIFSVSPDTSIQSAVTTMAEKDIGSLVVMDSGRLIGILTFREVIATLHENSGSLGGESVRNHMNEQPIVVTPDTDLNDVRRLMLEQHARYVPVMDEQKRNLLGVMSFYDVAKAVFEAQSFENKMLKSYIQDSPALAAAQET